MLTSSHILMGAALTSRSWFRPYQLALAWAGGFMPDFSIFLMVVYSRFAGISGAALWDKPNGLYWQEPWQFYSALSNSFFIWGLVLLAGFALFRFSARFKALGLGVLIFSGGYFLHICVDFITHADDAHVQFWPFSEWRFHSPISYWQREYYGRIVSLFELVMGLLLVIYLMRAFRQWPVRIATGFMAIPYGISLWLHF